MDYARTHNAYVEACGLGYPKSMRSYPNSKFNVLAQIKSVSQRASSSNVTPMLSIQTSKTINTMNYGLKINISHCLTMIGSKKELVYVPISCRTVVWLQLWKTIYPCWVNQKPIIWSLYRIYQDLTSWTSCVLIINISSLPNPWKYKILEFLKPHPVVPCF